MSVFLSSSSCCCCDELPPSPSHIQKQDYVSVSDQLDQYLHGSFLSLLSLVLSHSPYFPSSLPPFSLSLSYDLAGDCVVLIRGSLLELVLCWRAGPAHWPAFCWCQTGIRGIPHWSSSLFGYMLMVKTLDTKKGSKRVILLSP